MDVDGSSFPRDVKVPVVHSGSPIGSHLREEIGYEAECDVGRPKEEKAAGDAGHQDVRSPPPRVRRLVVTGRSAKSKTSIA